VGHFAKVSADHNSMRLMMKKENWEEAGEMWAEILVFLLGDIP